MIAIFPSKFKEILKQITNLVAAIALKVAAIYIIACVIVKRQFCFK